MFRDRMTLTVNGQSEWSRTFRDGRGYSNEKFC